MENLVGSINLRWLLLCLVDMTLVAAPSATKVEPPTWWSVNVGVRRISGNGHNLLAYLKIDPSTKAGACRFEVKGAGGPEGYRHLTGRRGPMNSNEGE